MDANQLRVRFSGAEENREEASERITLKTRSFRGEKRKGPNWLRRQMSREMSRDYDDTNGEYSAAVAAAAFAINSLDDESRIRARREASQPSLTKINNTPDDIPTRVPQLPALSFKHSDDVMENRRKEAAVPSPSFKRTLTSDEKRPNTTGSTPVVKKTPTFADTNFRAPTTTKPEKVVPRPNIPSTKPSAVAPTPIKPVTGSTKADTWEKAEMMKIKEWYDRTCETILEWENSKKKKAKRRAERKEGDTDWKRAKSLERYRNKILNIEAIAGGARAQAEENRRNAELKVKEKANKIRATGKLPPTCFCF